ncbi:MAG: 4-diphosphocytidyl-2-C-methyl-D-erythritol kinase [Bacteroidetes bacterium]|nr:4-diphosphocytidyl-2-C-methyl-D-erythritol kinase [Bacteroidota bacterium]
MICFPNAKINLGLNVVSKRADGYHNLETVFFPLQIRDALEVIVNESLPYDLLCQSGLHVDGCLHDNLVMKALRLVREKYDFPRIEAHLFKKIPSGAGLGGGSSDASSMLKLLNETFSLGIADAELAQLALKLGADCPFFVYNRPLFASGIGEVFDEIALSLEGYYFVLVKPDVHVSTKDAFGGIFPQKPAQSLKDIIRLPVTEWRNVMVNDFEKTVFAKHPEIAKVKEELYQSGAVYASMSGSGSSVYGIFSKETVFEADFPSYHIISP